MPKTTLSFYLHIIAIAVIVFALGNYLSSRGVAEGSPTAYGDSSLNARNDNKGNRETVYDRVMRTKTIRCGYGTWNPGVYKDLQTGQMSGLFVELINTMGKLNGLKIEWTAEIDWGQIPESIKSGKVDTFCAGMANDASRGKFLAYSEPLSYWTFDVLVRKDDKRFPEKQVAIADLNKPEFASAFTEGDVLETIVKNEFPNIKFVPLPLLGTPADNLLHVITGKTDFVVFPKIMLLNYEKENPGKLRLLQVQPPLRAFGNVIATTIDELQFQQLLNSAVRELVNSGAYASIMDKYDAEYPGTFLRVAKPYQIPTNP